MAFIHWWTFPSITCTLTERQTKMQRARRRQKNAGLWDSGVKKTKELPKLKDGKKMYLPGGDQTDKNSKLHISESVELKGKHGYKSQICAHEGSML